jgi:hypothetical protein
MLCYCKLCVKSVKKLYQAGPGAAGEEEAGGGAGGRGGGRHHRPRHGGRLEKRGRNSTSVGLLQRHTEITHDPLLFSDAHGIF